MTEARTPERALEIASLQAHGIRGAAWSLGGRIFQQLLVFATAVVLMRLLDPAVFGLVAMVHALVGFVLLTGEFGLTAAIVQRPTLEETHRSTIFWATALGGLIGTAVVMAAAPLLATFYDEPALIPVTRVLALLVALAGFGIVPRGILQRRLEFARMVRIDFLAAAAGGAVAIFAAWRGYGVWSLVVQLLVTTAASSILAMLTAGWRPRRVWSVAALADVYSFSAALFGSNTLNYWARNGDDVLVGRMVGATGLGIYSRAYNLMLLPITQVVDVVQRVMFPLLAGLQEDLAEVRRVYLAAVTLVVLLAAPMFAGLIAVAEPLVLGLFGATWAPAAPVLRVLAGAGLLQTFLTPVGWIYLSQGRTDRQLQWTIVATPVLLAAVFVGALIGSVEAVAWGYLVGHLVLLYPSLSWSGAVIDLPPRQVIRRVAPLVAMALLMAAAVAGADVLLPNVWGNWARLAALVPLGVVLYAGLLAVFRPHAMEHLAVVVRTLRTRADSPSGGRP